MRGDFNIVRFPSEISREGRLTSTLTGLSDFIVELQLVDFPLKGGKFTWSNNHSSPFYRIDMFLATLDWEEHFAMQSLSHRPL